MDSRATPPAPGHLEISVFGARKGECTVVHAPDGSWFVIDSFRTKGTSTTGPVASAYLSLLGVTSLRGLFLTHWHGDHTNGAAALVREFAATLHTVGLPSGTGERELASLISDLLPHPLRSKLIDDFVDLMSALREPSAANIHPVLLTDGSLLSPIGANWSLSALSPSFEDHKLQLATLAKFLPHQKSARASYDVNSGSAVLRLEANGVVAIFSSDLDIGETDQRGWRSIVKFHGGRLPAEFVKVGHHGSSTALHEPAWRAFAQGKPSAPAAAVTPFPASGAPLPREKQIKRLKKLTSVLHLSGIRAQAASKAGKVSVSRTPFSSYTKVSPTAFDQVGQVRYRFDPTGKATIDVFAPAHKL